MKKLSISKKVIVIFILITCNLFSISFADTTYVIDEVSELVVDRNIISPKYVAYCPESPDGLHDMWLTSLFGRCYVVYKPTDKQMFGSKEGGKCFSCQYCEEKLITQYNPLNGSIGRYATGYYAWDPNVIYGHGEYEPDPAADIIYTNYSISQLPYCGTSTLTGYKLHVVWAGK